MTDPTPTPADQARAWLSNFSSALKRGDVPAAVALFEPDAN